VHYPREKRIAVVLKSPDCQVTHGKDVARTNLD
jgi:hypothetical protein